MRKITEQAIYAFIEDRPFTGNNTVVTKEYIVSKGWLTRLYLFDNLIAEKVFESMEINITSAGYNTRTTRERLNGLPGVSVTSKQGQMYLNGKEWDGSWQTIQL